MNYKLINFFFDNSVNRACFYSNDWWIFSLEKTTCCLSSYNIEVTDITAENVLEAIYMVRCLNQVRDGIYLSYYELCAEFELLDKTIKDKVNKDEDVLILAHDAFLEYKGEIPFDDEDFEDYDYYMIPKKIEE